MQGTSDARQTMESHDELHGGVIRQRGNAMGKNIQEQNNGSNKTTPQPNKEPSPPSSKGSSVVLILLLLMVGITWGIAATAYFGVVDYKVLVEQASYIDKRRSVAMVTPYNKITFSIKDTEKVVTERGEPPVMIPDNQPSKDVETTNENMKIADKDEEDDTLKQTGEKVKVKETSQDPPKSRNSTPKNTKKPTATNTDGTGSTAWSNTSNINASINNPLHRPALPAPYTHDTTLSHDVILLTPPPLPMNFSLLCLKPVLKTEPASKNYQNGPEEDSNRDADRDDGKSVFNPRAPKDQKEHPEPLEEDPEENKMQKVVFNPFSPKYQVFKIPEEKAAENNLANSKVLVNPMSPKHQQINEDITTQLPQGDVSHYVKITSNPMSPKSHQVKFEQIFSFSPFKSTQGTTPLDKYDTHPTQLSTNMDGYKISANQIVLNKTYHHTQPNVLKPTIHLLPLQKQYMKPGFNKMFNKYKQRVFQHTSIALNLGRNTGPPRPPSPPTLSITPLNLYKDVATIIKTPRNQRQAVTNIVKVSNPNILSSKRPSSLRKVDRKVTNRTTVVISPLSKIIVQIKRTIRINKRHLRTTVPSTLPINVNKVKVVEKMRSFLNRTVVLTVVPNKAGRKPKKIMRPVPVKPAMDKLNCFNVNVTVVGKNGAEPRGIVAIYPVNKGLKSNRGVLRNKNHFKLLYGANPVNKRHKNTCHACLFCRPTLSGQVLNKKPSISKKPSVLEALSSLVSKISKSRLHLFGESSTNTEEGCATISEGVGLYARHVCGKLSKLFSFNIDNNMRNTVLITLAMILFYHALVLFIQLQIEARN